MGTFMCGVEMDSFPGKTDTQYLLQDLLTDLPPALSWYKDELTMALSSLTESTEKEAALGEEGSTVDEKVAYRKAKALLAEKRYNGIQTLHWALKKMEDEFGISQQIHDWHLSMENILSPDDFKDWTYSEPDDPEWKRTFED